MEPDVCNQDTEAYVTNLSYYHLVPFETDILEWLSIATDHADRVVKLFLALKSDTTGVPLASGAFAAGPMGWGCTFAADAC